MNNWTSTELNLDGVIADSDPKGVDLDNLIADIVESNSNTYFYQMIGRDKYWNIMPEFLTRLYEVAPSVKVYAMPTIHMWKYNPNYDLVERAQAVADLSAVHPNLAGLCFDDFGPMSPTVGHHYSPSEMIKIRQALDSAGRPLQLLVTVYYNEDFTLNAAELSKYHYGSGYSFDGIIFAVIFSPEECANGETDPMCNFWGPEKPEVIPYQLDRVRSFLLPGTSIYTLIYANGYPICFGWDGSKCGEIICATSTPQGVEEATEYAMSLSEGVVIYRLHTEYMGTSGWGCQSAHFAEKKIVIPQILRKYDTASIPLVRHGETWSFVKAEASQFVDFKIDLPAGASHFKVEVIDGNGDADVYVKFGEPPTLNSYDLSSTVSGLNEMLSITSPQQGRAYVMVYGKTRFFEKEVTCYYEIPSWVGEAGNGNTNFVSGARGQSLRFFTPEIPAGATNLEFRLNGGSGDSDLYVKYGAAAGIGSWDHRSLIGSNHSVAISSPNQGVYFVTVHGAGDFSGASLTVTWDEGGSNNNPGWGPELFNGDVLGLYGPEFMRFEFYTNVPAGATNLVLSTGEGYNDVDIFVRHDSETLVYRSQGYGNAENITIPSPTPGKYHLIANCYGPFNTNLRLSWQ